MEANFPLTFDEAHAYARNYTIYSIRASYVRRADSNSKGVYFAVTNTMERKRKSKRGLLRGHVGASNMRRAPTILTPRLLAL